MKKIIYCFFVTLMCLCCFSACRSGGGTEDSSSLSASETKESNIAFVQNEIVLSVGESVQAEIEISKKNVFIFWSISDENIATVSDDGVITALAVGQTICYAEFAGEKAMCLVKVVAGQAEPLLSISVPYDEEINLYVGDSLALKTTVKLGDSVLEDAQMVYEIDSEEILSIEDGRLSGISVGNATVFISATYEGQTVSTSLVVNVIEK